LSVTCSDFAAASVSIPINRITELLPWNWQPAQPQAQAA
jgi:hypothetical protein